MEANFNAPTVRKPRRINAPTSYIGLELPRPLVRGTPLVRAEPNRMPHCFAALHHIKKQRTVSTWFVGCVFERAISHHIVAMCHVVPLITTVYRTGEPLIDLFQKTSWVQGLLHENHRAIVVKAQRGNIEEHLWSHSGPVSNTQAVDGCQRP